MVTLLGDSSGSRLDALVLVVCLLSISSRFWFLWTIYAYYGLFLLAIKSPWKMADFIARTLAKHFVSVRSGLSMKRGAQALVRGDGAEAVQFFQEAVNAKTEILKGTRNKTVAQAMVGLASAHKLAGDELTAASTLTEALDILQETDPSDPDIHIYMNNLGVLLRNTGQVCSTCIPKVFMNKNKIITRFSSFSLLNLYI